MSFSTTFAGAKNVGLIKIFLSMPVKIRLQRQGRKFSAVYSIVVTDSRAPRDGKYIETLGKYNPNTNPATIELDFDKAMEWLQKGAQPTDTCRAILSYKGVLYKKHLLEGVRKGAFDEAEAEMRFQTWMTEKEQKIQAKRDRIKKSKAQIAKEKFEEESKIREERAREIEKKRSELLEAEAKEKTKASPDEVKEEAVPDDTAEVKETVVADTAEVKTEVPEEIPEKEEPEAENTEELDAEDTEEPEAEAAEEPKAEAAEEPKAEAGEEPEEKPGKKSE